MKAAPLQRSNAAAGLEKSELDMVQKYIRIKQVESMEVRDRQGAGYRLSQEVLFKSAATLTPTLTLNKKQKKQIKEKMAFKQCA